MLCLQSVLCVCVCWNVIHSKLCWTMNKGKSSCLSRPLHSLTPHQRIRSRRQLRFVASPFPTSPITVFLPLLTGHSLFNFLHIFLTAQLGPEDSNYSVLLSDSEASLQLVAVLLQVVINWCTLKASSITPVYMYL